MGWWIESQGNLELPPLMTQQGYPMLVQKSNWYTPGLQERRDAFLSEGSLGKETEAMSAGTDFAGQRDKIGGQGICLACPNDFNS